MLFFAKTPGHKGPYNWFHDNRRFKLWVKGWRTAQAEHEVGKGNDFDSKALNCPWRETIRCNAVDTWCDKQSCAVWHFLKGE